MHLKFSLHQFRPIVVKYLIIISIAFWIHSPTRHAKRYSYVPNEDIPNKLHISSTSISDNVTRKIQHIVDNNVIYPINVIYELKHFEIPTIGGEFTSRECISNERTALIVPYRNREEHLKIFLNYMHHHLQEQCISYRIFIVEQKDSKPFNRAKMFNYGAMEAIKLKFTCLVLHDVDLIPISTGNVYSCAKMPRHMSSSLDVFRYKLPYPDLFGGAVAISSDQFKTVNGMSNKFDGWGGEDDDFYKRLLKYDFKPCRFSPELSCYVMLQHNKEAPSTERFAHLKNSLKRQEEDGLNSLENNYNVRLEPLYTHLEVY